MKSVKVRKTQLIRRNTTIGALLNGSNDQISKYSHLKLEDFRKFLPVKLIHYLEQSPKIRTIGELLEQDLQDMNRIGGIGNETVKHILEFIRDIDAYVDIAGLNADKDQIADDQIAVKKSPVFGVYSTIILQYMKQMTERTREIFLVRFGREETLENTGIQFDLRKQRITQIIYDNLKVIRWHLRQHEQEFKRVVIETLVKENCYLDNKLVFSDTDNSFFINLMTALYPTLPVSKNKLTSWTIMRNPRYLAIYQGIENINIGHNTHTPVDLLNALGYTEFNDIMDTYRAMLASDKFDFLEKDGDVYINRVENFKEIVKKILQGSDVPMHINEILGIIRKDYGIIDKYNNRNFSSAYLKEDEDIYELDKYMFGLKKHLGYPEEVWPEINSMVNQHLLKLNRQANAGELYDHVLTRFPRLRSKYELMHMLKNNDEITHLGFFHYGLKSQAQEVRSLLKDVIREIFEKERYPLHKKMIYEMIMKKRYVKIEGLAAALRNADFIENYGAGYYGLKIHDRSNREKLEKIPDYIEKVIDEKLFPEPYIDKIVSYFIHMHMRSRRVLKTIFSEEDGIYLLPEDTDNPLVIYKRWNTVRIIRILLAALGSPLSGRDTNHILEQIGKKITEKDMFRLEYYGIKYENSCYYLKDADLKDAVPKDEVLKDEVLKDGVLKDAVHEVADEMETALDIIYERMIELYQMKPSDELAEKLKPYGYNISPIELEKLIADDDRFFADDGNIGLND